MRFASFARSFVDAGGRYAYGVTGGGASIELIDALIIGLKHVPGTVLSGQHPLGQRRVRYHADSEFQARR